MRFLILLFLLSVIPWPVAHGEEFYLVPVYARNVRGSDGEWSSYFLLTNPTDEPVAVELGETFGATNTAYCMFPEFSIPFPKMLQPHETRYICMPFEAAGAFTFTSSRPLITNFKIYLSRAVARTLTFQHIEPGRAWIAAGDVATIYGARFATGIARSNLIFVNPNNEVLTVSYTTVRTGISLPDVSTYVPVSTQVKVAPKSIAIVPLLEAPKKDCGLLVPCGTSPEQNVTLSGDRKFYVAASSIESDDAMFLSPVVARR